MKEKLCVYSRQFTFAGQFHFVQQVAEHLPHTMSVSWKRSKYPETPYSWAKYSRVSDLSYLRVCHQSKSLSLTFLSHHHKATHLLLPSYCEYETGISLSDQSQYLSIYTTSYSETANMSLNPLYMTSFFRSLLVFSPSPRKNLRNSLYLKRSSPQITFYLLFIPIRTYGTVSAYLLLICFPLPLLSETLIVI